MMGEHGGEPHPSLRILPWNGWITTELLLMANRSVGEVRKFVMVREMKLFMMLGPGKAHITRRCRAQYSEENAVRRSSNPSSSTGTNTPSTTMGWMLGSCNNSC